MCLWGVQLTACIQILLLSTWPLLKGQKAQLFCLSLTRQAHDLFNKGEQTQQMFQVLMYI